VQSRSDPSLRDGRSNHSAFSALVQARHPLGERCCGDLRGVRDRSMQLEIRGMAQRRRPGFVGMTAPSVVAGSRFLIRPTGKISLMCVRHGLAHDVRTVKSRARKIQFRLPVQADLGRPVPCAKIFFFRIIGNRGTEMMQSSGEMRREDVELCLAVVIAIILIEHERGARCSALSHKGREHNNAHLPASAFAKARRTSVGRGKGRLPPNASNKFRGTGPGLRRDDTE
jgi:hypothetical protein